MQPLFRSQLAGPLLEGWFAKESITLLAPDGTANVICSNEPLNPGFTPQLYADAQTKVLGSEFLGYHEVDFRPALVFGGRPGFVRHFQWTPEDGEQVTQIQFYYAANGRGYTATATTPSSKFGDWEDKLVQVMGGLSLGVA